MTTKTKPSTKRNPAHLEILTTPDKVDETTARIMSQPEVRAASVIQKFEGDSLDVNYLATELRLQTGAIKAGDTNRLEAMLGAQAHTLDALFANLARRAHSNMGGGYLEAATTYMKLALKAQAQAARTIQALGELKNPRHVAYVAQANISNGHQQVNNGQCLQADEKQIEQNKLSAGAKDELLPNTRTPSHSGTINPEMETVGALNRR